MNSLAEVQNQPHVEEVDAVETEDVPQQRFELEHRVAALQSAVMALAQQTENGPGLSLVKLNWLVYELGNLTLPSPGAPQQIKWARLKMEDWSIWAEEIKSVRKAAGIRRIATLQGMAPAERNRQLQMIEEEDVDLNELFFLVKTPKGIDRVLNLSLNKAGVEDEAERRKIIDSINPIHQGAIALEVASLRSRATATPISPIPSDPSPGTFGRNGPFDAGAAPPQSASVEIGS